MTPEQRQAAADRYVEGMQQGINRAVEEARAEVKDLKDALKDALGRFHTQGKAKDVVTALLAGAREEVTRLAAELTAARAELSEARRPVTLSVDFAERDEALKALERCQAEYRDRLQTEVAHSRALLVELGLVRSAVVTARRGEDTWQAEAKALANQRDEAKDSLRLMQAERDEAREALERCQAANRSLITEGETLRAELKHARVVARRVEDTWQTELKRTCAELTAARAEAAKWKEAVARENRNLVNNINKCITLQDAIQPVRKERDEARAEVERLKAGPDKYQMEALRQELLSAQTAWQNALAERNDLARKLEALKTVLFPAVRLEGL